MSYSLEKYPDEPIVVLTLPADYDVQQDVPHLIQDMAKIFGSLTQPVAFVTDLTTFKLAIQDIIVGINTMVKDNQRYRDLIRENVAVTQNPAVRSVIKGLDTNTFGNIKMSVFNTLEEALAYVRSQR